MIHSRRLNSHSMKAFLPRLTFSVALLMLPATLIADLDTPHYRVEIIVFAHVEGRSDARSADEIADFTALTDPVFRARKASMPAADDSVDPPVSMDDAHEDVLHEDGLHSDDEREDDAVHDPESDALAREQAREAELEAVLELIDTLADLEEGALMPELPVWPEPYLALEELSPKMARALARLEGSSAHKVLSWRAWHQPLASGSVGNRVRIHDDHPVAADWIALTPSGTVAPVGDESLDSHNYQPLFHYRLDGGVRLRQRQFMHLESDLHWRVRQEPSPWPSTLDLDEDTTGKFRVHRLEQSRTVRPGRLEYFDSSWLGMLVLIEPIAPLDGSDVDFDDELAERD